MLEVTRSLLQRAERIEAHLLAAAETAPHPAIVHLAAGRLAEALDACRRGILTHPDSARHYRAFGHVLLAQRRFDAARRAFERAIALKPSAAAARADLGAYHFQRGEIDRAVACYEEALRIDPACAIAAWRLSLAWERLGDADRALDCLLQTLALVPDLATPEQYVQMGKTLWQKQRHQAALQCFERAAIADPNCEEAHRFTGALLLQAGKPARALPFLERSTQLHPPLAAGQYLLGVALRQVGRTLEAIVALERSLQLNSAVAATHYELGLAYVDREEYRTARHCFEQTLQLDPNHASARMHWGQCLAIAGDLERGLAAYEARLQLRLRPLPSIPQPRWQGEDLRGKTLLVWGSEGGLGDAIQYVRYIPELARRGARTILECHPSQKTLFATIAGVDRLIAKDEPLPDCDYWTPICSLPHRCGTTLATIPKAPYLSALKPHTYRVTAPEGFRKIGLVWATNLTGYDPWWVASKRRKSCQIEDLLPLFSLPRVRLYSLQVGEFALTPDATNLLPIVDLAHHIHDFADTAVLMSQLDLVISIDSAAAHLAGALGLPVWTLIPFAPDPRWLLDREDSPWYPTLRLFRQRRDEPWRDVLRRVAQALETMPLLAGAKASIGDRDR